MTTPNVQSLLDTAAYLVNQAAILSGTPQLSDFDPNNKATWWPAMVEQARNNRLPHDWVNWGPGVLPDQAGNNLGVPRSYDTHKALWRAAQSGEPLTPGGADVYTLGVKGWPDALDRPFRIETFQKDGPKAVNQAIKDLMASPCGIAWMASTGANLGEPQLDPISR